MKCSHCGVTVQEGEFFCPKCGQEIQWVPDYEPLGNYIEREKQLKKVQEERELAKKRALEESKRKKKRQRTIWITAIAFILLLTCLGLLLGMKVRENNQNYNDFDYQIRMAETSFSNGRYEESLEYVERALELKNKDVNARLLKAQILIKEEKDAQAIRLLTAVIAEDSDNVSAYGLLLKLYLVNDNTAQIKELLDACTEESILSKYADYICSNPVFGLAEGTYSAKKQVSLYGKTDVTAIYYTLDGSEPTKESMLYTESITLEEGTTTLKAVAENAKGILSDVVTRKYVISLQPPAAPKISPSSGTFTTNMDTQIYIIVPEGCTAYYAFDRKPSIADNPYNPDSPVKMLEGSHTFYAILVDQYGKVSSPGSAVYNLIDPE